MQEHALDTFLDRVSNGTTYLAETAEYFIRVRCRNTDWYLTKCCPSYDDATAHPRCVATRKDD